MEGMFDHLDDDDVSTLDLIDREDGLLEHAMQ